MCVQEQGTVERLNVGGANVGEVILGWVSVGTGALARPRAAGSLPFLHSATELKRSEI